MKYFGSLDKDYFENNSQKDFEDYLFTNKIVELKFTGKGDIENIKDGILTFHINHNEAIGEPNNEFVNEFYSFILNIFNYDIIEGKFEFFKFFNEEIYGLEYQEQKKAALNHFNEIFNDIYTNAITLFEEKISETGIKHTYTSGRLKMLYYQQNGYKSNLIKLIKINQYLIGNKEFFEKEKLIEKFNTINDTIYFETNLQIFIELNDRYGFEEDLYFTQIRFDKEKFEKYKGTFKTFESYLFTKEKIKSFTKDHKAHIESLFEVLVEQNLIANHKENFILYIKNEFDLTLSKIISYEKSNNYFHDKRVLLFTEEWTNLTSKK